MVRKNMHSINNHNHHLPQEHEVNDILNKVHSVCVFGSGNKFSKKKLDKNSLAALAFAEHRKNQYNNPFIAKLSQTERLNTKCYEQFASIVKEPEDAETREKYLAGLAIFTKIGAYAFASGGCLPMTHIAFIDALNKELSCGINYVRFNNKSNPQVEEINALVLGDWPKPGCLIVSPWEGDFGIAYTWNGSCKGTPSLNKNNLDQARSLFSISREDKFQEKKFAKTLLNTMNYTNWLKDDFLVSNKKKIKAEFLKIIHDTDFFKKNEKFLKYQDLLMLGATSVSHNNELKEKQRLLIKEIGNTLYRAAQAAVIQKV